MIFFPNLFAVLAQFRRKKDKYGICHIYASLPFYLNEMHIIPKGAQYLWGKFDACVYSPSNIKVSTSSRISLGVRPWPASSLAVKRMSRKSGYLFLGGPSISCHTDTLLLCLISELKPVQSHPREHTHTHTKSPPLPTDPHTPLHTQFHKVCLVSITF